MIKLIFFFSLLISSNTFANCKRPNWAFCYKIVNNKCINTRHYILYRDGINVKLNHKNIVKSGLWTSFYSNTSLSSPRQIEIDHILPFKFMKDNGGCDRIEEIYNDEENLVIASKKENRAKSSLLIVPFITKAPYREKQCKICNKYKLKNCNLVCL